jgi:hypothetical protein
MALRESLRLPAGRSETTLDSCTVQVFSQTAIGNWPRLGNSIQSPHLSPAQLLDLSTQDFQSSTTSSRPNRYLPLFPRRSLANVSENDREQSLGARSAHYRKCTRRDRGWSSPKDKHPPSRYAQPPQGIITKNMPPRVAAAAAAAFGRVIANGNVSLRLPSPELSTRTPKICPYSLLFWLLTSSAKRGVATDNATVPRFMSLFDGDVPPRVAAAAAAAYARSLLNNNVSSCFPYRSISGGLVHTRPHCCY